MVAITVIIFGRSFTLADGQCSGSHQLVYQACFRGDQTLDIDANEVCLERIHQLLSDENLCLLLLVRWVY